MNNELNTTPVEVYSAFFNPAEAYNVGGAEAQKMWIEGQRQVKAARRASAIESIAMTAGACAIFASFGYAIAQSIFA